MRKLCFLSYIFWKNIYKYIYKILFYNLETGHPPVPVVLCINLYPIKKDFYSLIPFFNPRKMGMMRSISCNLSMAEEEEEEAIVPSGMWLFCSAIIVRYSFMSMKRHHWIQDKDVSISPSCLSLSPNDQHWLSCGFGIEIQS